MSYVSDLAIVARHAAGVEKFSEGDTTRAEIVKAFKSASPEMRASMAATARAGLARHSDTTPDGADKGLAVIGQPPPDAMGEDDKEFIGTFLGRVFDLWKGARGGLDKQTAINSAIQLLDTIGDDAPTAA